MVEGKMETCPVCHINDDRIVLSDVPPVGKKIECPRCKEFRILDFPQFTPPDSKFGTKLSAWIRESNEWGAEPPQLTTDSLENLQSSLPEYSPREKQVRLLKNIERMTLYPGHEVLLDLEYDIPLSWASTQEEFLYYIESLKERGLLRITDKDIHVVITADGWDYLEQHERHIEERTQAFVAMSFSTNLKHIYEGPISNAIIKAGYKPHRVDAEPHIDRIDAKIIAEIKNSRFIVADVTQHKRGVYFEAGYALGLGLPVIWCVRKDHLIKVHFDTRQFNHIDWKSESDLETRLFDSICANIGKRKESP